MKDSKFRSSKDLRKYGFEENLGVFSISTSVKSIRYAKLNYERMKSNRRGCGLLLGKRR